MSASLRLLAMGTAASQRLLARSTFTGDSTTTLGTADTGQVWTANSNIWGRIGGAAYTPTGSPASRATIDAGVSNARVGVTLATRGTNQAGLVFRFVDTSNYWFARAMTTGDAQLYRVVGGTPVQILGLTATGAAGDRLEVDFRGSALSVLLNGVVIGSATDATHQTATRHGLYINNATGWRLTEFQVLR